MDFRPTHIITLTGPDNGEEPVEIPVQLVDGAAYTHEEWDASSNADWERTDEGKWLFQGRVSPHSGVEVSVIELTRREHMFRRSTRLIDTASAALERERAAGREPDRRSWHAVEVARAAASGAVTLAELRDAADDAYDAYAAHGVYDAYATDAAYAAYDAVYDAYDAAEVRDTSAARI